MSPDDRHKLRDAALAAMNGTQAHWPERTDWHLQTSNSFRRVGVWGDGDVLSAVNQRDGHPDLLAAPGVLDYVVAAQPAVVLELLAYVDLLESRLSRLDEIETHLIKMRTVVDDALKEVFR